MMIIPSIDIKDGQCVRLKQGDFNQTVVYSDEPQDVARVFSERGAKTLHVVDLDGAKNGKISQLDVIKNIVSSFAGAIQVGGGIRQKSDIDQLLNLGVNRVVIGTRAAQDISQTLEWIKEYGSETIILALDFKLIVNVPYIAISGWQEDTNLTLWDVLVQYQTLQTVLCTDITKDGMQEGPNFKFYEECRGLFPGIKVQASGGIRNLDDVKRLQDLGVSGAIIGKAIYEKKISLEEVILCLK